MAQRFCYQSTVRDVDIKQQFVRLELTAVNSR